MPGPGEHHVIEVPQPDQNAEEWKALKAVMEDFGKGEEYLNQTDWINYYEVLTKGNDMDAGARAPNKDGKDILSKWNINDAMRNGKNPDNGT